MEGAGLGQTIKNLFRKPPQVKPQSSKSVSSDDLFKLKGFTINYTPSLTIKKSDQVTKPVLKVYPGQVKKTIVIDNTDWQPELDDAAWKKSLKGTTYEEYVVQKLEGLGIPSTAIKKIYGSDRDTIDYIGDETIIEFVEDFHYSYAVPSSYSVLGSTSEGEVEFGIKQTIQREKTITSGSTFFVDYKVQPLKRSNTIRYRIASTTDKYPFTISFTSADIPASVDKVLAKGAFVNEGPLLAE